MTNVLSRFLKYTFEGNLKPTSIALVIILFIILRIILAAVSVNIADPGLINYRSGNLLPVHGQDLIMFLLILPISLWVYITCWQSSKNFESFYGMFSSRAILILIFLGQLNELFSSIKILFN